MPGRFHHVGCDVQRCPVCGDQMMCCDCRFDEDGMDEDDELFIDSNGCIAKRTSVDGHDVIVHYDDIPESDITTVHGIPVTTALRTVIDIAIDVGVDELDQIVQDCLERRLFTVEEARSRLEQPDMQARPGAELLRRALPHR